MICSGGILVAGVHDEKFVFVRLEVVFIKGEESGAVVEISGMAFKSQDPSVLDVAGLDAVGREFFMFSFMEESALRVCCALYALLFFIRIFRGLEFIFIMVFSVFPNFLLQSFLVTSYFLLDILTLVIITISMGFDMVESTNCTLVLTRHYSIACSRMS